MANYRYQSRNTQGQLIEGDHEANISAEQGKQFAHLTAS